MKPPVSRRQFLRVTSAAVVGTTAFSPRRLAAAAAAAPAPESAVKATRLQTGWQFSRGGLSGSWETRANTRDSRDWQAVEIPHCYNAQDAVDPDTHYYQGRVCYRTLLRLDNPFAGGRTLLHFEAAAQRADVYVAMEKVASHEGGYDEFVVDITDAATRYLARAESKGEVPIVVVCDNSREPDTVPSILADFTAYGGLHRPVSLVYVPATSIERVHVLPQVSPTGAATVAVRARLYRPGGAADDVRVSVQVTDPKGRVVHASKPTLAAWPGVREIATFSVPSPALWSPRSPSLYRCTVTVESASGTHTSVERFGLRRVDFTRGGPFKLNGAPLFLRGTHRHQDHAGVGSALTDDVTRREMELIKDVGANFIRLGHYQQSSLVLDLCDELGLLVWEEVQWCRGTLSTERSRHEVRTLLRSLIDQHLNHPSIVFWGLGNEIGWPEEAETFDKESIRGLVRELAAIAHEADPSRLTALRRTEYCADLVDVFAPSIWAGWYSGRYIEYKKNAEALVKETPTRVFHAEWGADSHAGRHSEDPDKMLAQIETGQGTAERGLDYLLTGGQGRASRDGDWSESYACNLFDWHLKEQDTMRDWFAGSAQWVFKDFSTPHRDDNPIPYINQKGLVERDLTLKEGYFVFQSYWAEKPMARIYAHSWPVRWGAADESKMLKVYSNCPRVELFLNGVSCGVRQRNSQDFPAAGLRWLTRLREGENHVRAVGTSGQATVVDEIRFEYRTRPWGPPAGLTLKEARRDGDRILVEAEVCDAQGDRCLDSRVYVRFDLIGDGRLLDNLGTSTGSRRIQVANGRAALWIAPGTGRSVVSVASPPLPTALLQIPR